jgi:hypothetical protein
MPQLQVKGADRRDAAVGNARWITGFEQVFRRSFCKIRRGVEFGIAFLIKAADKDLLG